LKTNILDVPIDVVTREEALNKLLQYLKNDSKSNHLLITPNPEMVMRARKDAEFMEIIKKADLVVPDGIGVVMASKLNKEKIKERVAGCDLIFSLFESDKRDELTCYIVGGKPGVAEIAKKNIEARYTGVKVVGLHDGYFDDEKEKKILEEIKNLKPKLLLVGLGFPRQEKWIYKHKKNLPVCMSAGVGGSIDVMAGVVKRAPEIYRKLGLEWFYRLMCQPQRIFRMMILPVFVLHVLLYKLLRRGN